MLDEVFNSDADQSLNYSIDLISGLPGVSLADWANTLHTAVNVMQPSPNHLSIYDLQIESGTVFGKWYDDNDQNVAERTSRSGTWHSTQGVAPNGGATPPPLPSDEEAAFQYQFTAGYLRAKGFEHYEVSSYARIATQSMESSYPNDTVSSPWRSQHNQVYWGYETSWYSIGLGATSFVRDQIVARPRTMVDYIKWVQSGDDALEKRQPAKSSDLDFLMDVALKRLRTKEGLDLEWVERRFGSSFVSAIEKGATLGVELGLATLSGENRNTSRCLQLVDSRGLLYSNSIISSIFVELENNASKDQPTT